MYALYESTKHLNLFNFHAKVTDEKRNVKFSYTGGCFWYSVRLPIQYIESGGHIYAIIKRNSILFFIFFILQKPTISQDRIVLHYLENTDQYI